MSIRKINYGKTVSFNIPQELADRLERLAKEKFTSESSIIRQALDSFITKKKEVK